MALLDESTIRRNLIRCTGLMETSSREPDIYKITAGDFDGAGLSWGCHQWNFGKVSTSDTLSPLWQSLITNHEATCQAAITNASDYTYWKNLIMTDTWTNRHQFGTNITDPANNHAVVEPWKTYFANLGASADGQDVQINQGATPYYNNAITWKNTFGLFSLRGLALMYDRCIQQGTIHNDNLISADIAAMDTTGKTREEIETAKLQIIAQRNADYYTGDLYDIIHDRGFAIANGSGYVYTTLFVDTNEFGLTLDPAFSSDVDTDPPPPAGTVTDKIIFGNILPSQTVTNTGQVEAPVTITIIGACTNPKITNLTTGEYIRFKNLTMTANDTLIIDTTYGQKKVTLNGTNVFNKLDFNSTFFLLKIGDNEIDFADDLGSPAAEIHFSYRNLLIEI